jgi:hypothetical protein
MSVCVCVCARVCACACAHPCPIGALWVECGGEGARLVGGPLWPSHHVVQLSCKSQPHSFPRPPPYLARPLQVVHLAGRCAERLVCGEGNMTGEGSCSAVMLVRCSVIVM